MKRALAIVLALVALGAGTAQAGSVRLVARGRLQTWTTPRAFKDGATVDWAFVERHHQLAWTRLTSNGCRADFGDKNLYVRVTACRPGDRPARVRYVSFTGRLHFTALWRVER